MKDRKKGALGLKMWFLIWGLGLTAQICWNIENQWFNTFVYAKISKDPSIITGMLSCSAAAMMSASTSLYFFLPTVRLHTMQPSAAPRAPTSADAPPPPGVGAEEDS